MRDRAHTPGMRFASEFKTDNDEDEEVSIIETDNRGIHSEFDANARSQRASPLADPSWRCWASRCFNLAPESDAHRTDGFLIRN